MVASSLTILLLIGAARFGTELGLGADYSSQQYWPSLYDTLEPGSQSDTVNVETEARGSLSLSLDISPEAGRGFEARNYLGFSTRSLRDRLELAFRGDIASWLGLQVADETEFKVYHSLVPTADTLYSTDHVANSGRLQLDVRPGEALTFSVWDRVQLYHYPEPDSYTYDYSLNELGLGVRRQFGLISEADADYTWSRRYAGDQSYTGHDLDVGLDWYSDAGPVIGLSGDLSRRSYAAREWSYLELGPGISFNGDFTDYLSLDFSNESRWTWHDSASSVHRDVFANTARLSLDARLGSNLTLHAGPQHELERGLPKPNNDDYRELAFVSGLDLLVARRLWLSFEDRLGRRRYPLADSSLQTNYAFNEVNIFLDWTVLSGRAGSIVLDGMVSISPEWHARQTDNFSTRIYTLELKYRF